MYDQKKHLNSSKSTAKHQRERQMKQDWQIVLIVEAG